MAERRAAVLETIDSFALIAVTSEVLERAAGPFPTLIGSLDAIHLASALMVHHEMRDLSFATHDLELGLAARAMGFSVEGRQVLTS